MSLTHCVIEYTTTHGEIKGVGPTFQKDADQFYPWWKEELDYIGESSVQAATSDWHRTAVPVDSSEEIHKQ